MKKKGKNAKLYLIGMIIGGMTLGLTTVIADTIINSTNVSYKTTTVKAALDDLYGLTADDVWQKIYPVGSIYISVSGTNPSQLFGGTWTSFGQGRTLIGVGTGTDSNSTSKTFAANESGGEYNHTLTISEMPSHKHVGVKVDATYAIWTCDMMYSSNGSCTFRPKSTYTADDETRISTGYTGSNSPHNNLQPYITVYMWKRTA